MMGAILGSQLRQRLRSGQLGSSIMRKSTTQPRGSEVSVVAGPRGRGRGQTKCPCKRDRTLYKLALSTESENWLSAPVSLRGREDCGPAGGDVTPFTIATPGVDAKPSSQGRTKALTTLVLEARELSAGCLYRIWKGRR